MKPILFNTAMVRAILDGEKTCTRRIIKKEIPEGYEPLGFVLYPTDDKELGNLVFAGKGANVYYAKPPYKVGDILYVRETWKKYKKRIGEGDSCRLVEFYSYKADEDKQDNPSEFYESKWKPSIHMPKEAARIFLKVTSVRAERLKDITDKGCLSEGIREFTKDGIVKKYDTEPNMHTWQEMPRTPKGAFEKLWNSTVNVKKYWDGWTNLFEYNPWVWVIEFEKVEK
ncbi:hypothetical protein [Clostridium perfringens]|uniref:hypothetical protein n=1 Tax=Clostridium perfringens TaxID=1502 RepID=UPI0024BD02F8|nr:hypothetical protein [Clostridium perfringens]